MIYKLFYAKTMTDLYFLKLELYETVSNKMIHSERITKAPLNKEKRGLYENYKKITTSVRIINF